MKRTIKEALAIYHATYQDEMNARSAFVDAIKYLTDQRWSWDVSPHSLTVRAGELILDNRYRPPALQTVIERSAIALSDRLRDDLIIYVSDIYDSVECKWIEFLRDNRGDLESEIALSKIWRGAAWAPCGRHIMLSLEPIYDLMSQDTDREIRDYEHEENRSFDFDIRKELKRC
jgi:hypothetical protein